MARSRRRRQARIRAAQRFKGVIGVPKRRQAPPVLIEGQSRPRAERYRVIRRIVKGPLSPVLHRRAGKAQAVRSTRIIALPPNPKLNAKAGTPRRRNRGRWFGPCVKRPDPAKAARKRWDVASGKQSAPEARYSQRWC